MIIADFAGILDALSIKKVLYVGHDVGAGLGWQFVMTYPDRVLSFVTMTVGHPVSLAEGSFTAEGARSSWYLMVNQTPLWGELWRAGDGRLARTAIASHPDVEEVLPHMLQPSVLESYMMIDRVNPITDFLIAYANGALPEMPSVHVPVLGIAGTKDQFMWRSQIENSGKYVKGPWRFAAVDVGHWIPLDAPRQTNKLLLEWLSQVRAATTTVAPSEANASEMARPMPEPPPGDEGDFVLQSHFVSAPLDGKIQGLVTLDWKQSDINVSCIPAQEDESKEDAFNHERDGGEGCRGGGDVRAERA